jgi:hypothetical protein
MTTPRTAHLAEVLMKLKGNSESERKATLTQFENNIQFNSSEPNEIDLDACNCRKSRCLKLYCQCFAAQRLCGSSCRCDSCSNTSGQENTRANAMKAIEFRNPSAFNLVPGKVSNIYFLFMLVLTLYFLSVPPMFRVAAKKRSV